MVKSFIAELTKLLTNFFFFAIKIFVLSKSSNFYFFSVLYEKKFNSLKYGKQKYSNEIVFFEYKEKKTIIFFIRN